jgi:N-acetylornithine carbamoyltransferase
MKTTLRGKHFISTMDWSREDLDSAIETAAYLKYLRATGQKHSHILEDKTLFMVFFEESTRTRNSFEAGMTQMGGHAHFLTQEATQIGHGETPKDTANVLARYGDAIAIRDCTYGRGNRFMREMAKDSPIPVYNMQCDIDHPCQSLGDVMTIQEKMGKQTRGLKFVISWTYAPSYTRPLSVPQSLVWLMPRYGMDVVLAHPPEYRLMPDVVAAAKRLADENGTSFRIMDDMDEAFRGADVVYPKSWGCLEFSQDPKVVVEVNNRYKDWICDQRRMDLTNKNSIYMHCMPYDRGVEVTDEVVDGPHSVVFDQAENRLHIQKAIMALTMGARL